MGASSGHPGLRCPLVPTKGRTRGLLGLACNPMNRQGLLQRSSPVEAEKFTG